MLGFQKNGSSLQLYLGPPESIEYTILQKHISSSIQIIKLKCTKMVKCSPKNSLIPMESLPMEVEAVMAAKAGQMSN